LSHIIVARWRAREGSAEIVESILHELARAARSEPGNLQFTVHRHASDRNEFLLYEVYTSKQAFDDHRATEHFKKLVLGGAVPLLASREINAYAIVDA
jgi:quinol monooxygenase YgiN